MLFAIFNLRERTTRSGDTGVQDTRPACLKIPNSLYNYMARALYINFWIFLAENRQTPLVLEFLASSRIYLLVFMESSVGATANAVGILEWWVGFVKIASGSKIYSAGSQF